MSEQSREEMLLVVKLTINCESIRRVCVQRLKLDPKTDSLRSNVKFSKLKRLAIDYLHQTEKNGATAKKKIIDETSDGSVEEPNEIYQNYNVNITYYDEDGDEITISSDIELVEALENLRRIEGQPKTRVLRACAVVKRKGGEEALAEVRNVPPFKNIRVARMKRRAAQMAKADMNKIGRQKGLPDAPKNHPIKSGEISYLKNKCGQEFNDFVHLRHTCDGCGVSPIVGFRFKAINHVNFDYCQNCKNKYDYEGREDLVFRKAQRNSDRHFVASTSRGMHFFNEDKDLAEAIRMSLATLAEEFKRKSEKAQKVVSEVAGEISTLVLDKTLNEGSSSDKKERLENVVEDSHNMGKSKASFKEDEEAVKPGVSFDGYVSADEGKEFTSKDANVKGIAMDQDAVKNVACEAFIDVNKTDEGLSDIFVDATEEKHRDNIDESPSNHCNVQLSEQVPDISYQKTDTLDEDLSVEQPDGKTIDKSESDDWDVLDEGIDHPTDELACATQLMGSSLYKNDLGATQKGNNDL
eukprot:CAMPEP_0194283358 /NCGR_PEP_ID=MMETSP0169-20130528/25179_1 /TAXON_ID=218684 /ORGANISM="Corethron pennatum, Strain L29A3" /LENGTH=523 /DNA_ID=CAMNT_0039028933 /DNA_START=88 /DNA_END=1659 /DNA_ORIENTATION=-